MFYTKHIRRVSNVNHDVASDNSGWIFVPVIYILLSLLFYFVTPSGLFAEDAAFSSNHAIGLPSTPLQTFSITVKNGRSQRTNYILRDNNLYNEITYHYRLKDVDVNRRMIFHRTIKAVPGTLVDKFFLFQNSPNPFNPVTTIRFEVPQNSGKVQRIKLSVFNSLGQLTRRLHNGPIEGGVHEIRWDSRNDHGRRVASGFYLIRMESDNFIQVSKMVLLG